MLYRDPRGVDSVGQERVCLSSSCMVNQSEFTEEQGSAPRLLPDIPTPTKKLPTHQNNRSKRGHNSRPIINLFPQSQIVFLAQQLIYFRSNSQSLH